MYESISGHEHEDDESPRFAKNRGVLGLIQKRRFFLELILVITFGLMFTYTWIYFQRMRKHQLKYELMVEHRFDLIEAEVNRIISNTTSNTAVLNEINRLREDLQATQKNVNNQVKNTLSDVNTQLSDTKSQLENAINNAKQIINDEVDKVKNDMDVYISNTNQRLTTESNFIKYQVAGTFTLLGCLISIAHVIIHLRNMGRPIVQRRVLAILWMVPIYSVTSWLSLVFPRIENTVGAIRDCYEAYAVYTFIAFLIAVLSENVYSLTAAVSQLSRHIVLEDDLTSLAEVDKYPTGTNSTSPTLTHTKPSKPPLPCFHYMNNRRSIAATIIYQCQMMAMQFVFFKPILAGLPFLLKACGVDYDHVPILSSHSHSINWSCPRLYINLMLNISVAVAFYGLLCFYHATEKALAWCDPWPKFLCIKGVVFMTFWQGFAINALSGAGFVDEKSAHAAQNLIICIEMFIASLLHIFIFPHEEWQEGYKKVKEQSMIFRDTLALKDFINDIKGIIYKRAFEDINHHMNDAEYVSENSNISNTDQIENNVQVTAARVSQTIAALKKEDLEATAC